MQEMQGAYRHDILQLLEAKSDCIGVELGVAAGGFSRRMVESGRFSQFFGVDMYADTHDTTQYKQALRHVGIFAPYKLLRMTFDEAYDLFEDESLDFIYVDGYAHSGQEGGETIFKWAKKVKIGGVIAGDDYHPKWPLVIDAVDTFLASTGFKGYVTTKLEPEIGYSEYPSWATVKTASTDLDAPADQVAKGKAVADKVAKKRMREKRAMEVLHKIVGEDRYEKLRKWNRERKAKRT